MYNEFSLIDKIATIAKKNSRKNTPVIIPPGDDAALLSSVHRPVISTDTQREGVHFKMTWQTPYEIGYKAVVVTLSDLAASYATPVAFFINLALPQYVSEPTVMGIYDGVMAALKKYNCSLGGGNISSASELALDLFAIGEGDEKIFPMRSMAVPGNGLYVTGPLGFARAGLDALNKTISGFQALVDHFKKPVARFDAAEILKRYGVTCVMDISDGLSGDAHHIASASGISIEFHIDPVHFTPVFHRYCEQNELSAKNMALAGGEEYELLFACQPDLFDKIRMYLPGAFTVGTCLPFTGIHIINPPQKNDSFTHGA